MTTVSCSCVRGDIELIWFVKQIVQNSKKHAVLLLKVERSCWCLKSGVIVQRDFYCGCKLEVLIILFRNIIKNSHATASHLSSWLRSVNWISFQTKCVDMLIQTLQLVCSSDSLCPLLNLHVLLIFGKVSWLNLTKFRLKYGFWIF